MKLDTERLTNDITEKGCEIMNEGNSRVRTFLKWAGYTVLFFISGPLGVIGMWFLSKGIKRFIKKYEKKED